MYRLPLILALSAIVAGCASTSTVSPSLDKGITIIQRDSNRVTFHNVQHNINADGQSIINGSLKRKHNDTRPVRGHIDYKLIDKNNHTLESGKVAYSNAIKKRLPNRRVLQDRMKHRPSYFSIPLKYDWKPDQYHLYLNWDNTSHSAQS